MTFVKLDEDGNYYVFRRRCGAGRRGRSFGRIGYGRSISKQYLVKHDASSGGAVSFGSSVTFPSELVGKRIRFKVEVIE